MSAPRRCRRRRTATARRTGRRRRRRQRRRRGPLSTNTLRSCARRPPRTCPPPSPPHSPSPFPRLYTLTSKACSSPRPNPHTPPQPTAPSAPRQAPRRRTRRKRPAARARGSRPGGRILKRRSARSDGRPATSASPTCVLPRSARSPAGRGAGRRLLGPSASGEPFAASDRPGAIGTLSLSISLYPSLSHSVSLSTSLSLTLSRTSDRPKRVSRLQCMSSLKSVYARSIYTLKSVYKDRSCTLRTDRKETGGGFAGGSDPKTRIGRGSGRARTRPGRGLPWRGARAWARATT